MELRNRSNCTISVTIRILCLTYQISAEKEYADSASELHSQRPADHEVDASALDGAVGSDGADGENGGHQDCVRDGKLQEGLEEAGVAHDVPDSEKEDRAEHGERDGSEHS